MPYASEMRPIATAEMRRRRRRHENLMAEENEENMDVVGAITIRYIVACLEVKSQDEVAGKCDLERGAQLPGCSGWQITITGRIANLAFYWSRSQSTASQEKVR